MFVNKLTDSKCINDSVLSFGNFDGIHLGHQKIISKVIELSKLHSIPSVILSFNPHTNYILDGNHFKTLLTHRDKINILKSYKIDYYGEIEFNLKFSKLSAEDFMSIIINKYNPSYIVFGYDNYFGYKKSGSFEFVDNNQKYNNIKCIKVEEFQYLSNYIKSSELKKMIKNNDIYTANKYLYQNYKIYGKVIRGYKIGRHLGFPTANINPSKEQIIPSNGVYDVNLIVDKKIYRSVCNIGVAPTLQNNNHVTIEVHVIDKMVDLYNLDVKIEFKSYIRSEKKFKNKNDLIRQIKQDIEIVKMKG